MEQQQQQQASQAYVLGHTDSELQRLEEQGLYLREMTQNLLTRAGIQPGMRVLDFGSGTGDVSLIAAEMVGPLGEVVAVDRAPEAVARTKARLQARNVRHVRVIEGDENTLGQHANPSDFDALVGRLVLIHQRNPVQSFYRLTHFVRPGGKIAIYEIDIEGGNWSHPHLPLFSQTIQRIVDTFTRLGLSSDMTVKLRDAFEYAGIQPYHLMREGSVEGGADSRAYEWLAHVAHTLAPAMEKLGIASAEELGVESLAARLLTEAVDMHASFIPVFFVAAWGQKPNGAAQ